MGVYSNLDILSSPAFRGTVDSKFTVVLLFLYFVLPFLQYIVLDFFNKGVTEARAESEIGSEALTDNKPSGLMEREDDLLIRSELGGGTQSDSKLSGSMERDNASLKQSSLEAAAKKRSHSSLDSVPSKRMKKITPFKQKRQHSTGKYVQTAASDGIFYNFLTRM